MFEALTFLNEGFDCERFDSLSLIKTYALIRRVASKGADLNREDFRHLYDIVWRRTSQKHYQSFEVCLLVFEIGIEQGIWAQNESMQVISEEVKRTQDAELAERIVTRLFEVNKDGESDPLMWDNNDYGLYLSMQEVIEAKRQQEEESITISIE